MQCHRCSNCGEPFPKRQNSVKIPKFTSTTRTKKRTDEEGRIILDLCSG